MRFDKSYYVDSTISNYTDYRKKRYADLAKTLVARLGLTAETKILDFGCATGCLLKELELCGIVNAVGTDISHWAISQGRQMFGFDKERLQHYNLHLLEQEFDVVFFLDVLEHMPPGDIQDTMRLVSADTLVVRLPVSANEGEDFVLDVSKNDKTHIQIHPKCWWGALLLDYGFETSDIFDESPIYESEGVLARVFRRNA